MTQFDDHVPEDELKSAVDQESQHFKDIYLWLKKSMPSVFFREIPQEWIISIVHSLMSFRLQDYFSHIRFKQASVTLCIDNPKADIRILKQFPDRGIRSYTTYISRERVPFLELEGRLRIATTYFTEAALSFPTNRSDSQEKELISELCMRSPKKNEEHFKELVQAITPHFLRKMPLERQITAVEMYERALSRDHCQYEVHHNEDWEKQGAYSMQLIVAWKNVPKHNFLYRLARVIFQHKLVMRRVNATYVNPFSTNSIFLLSIGLHGQDGKAAWDSADIADLLQEIVTLKYFGGVDHIDEVFVSSHLLSGNMGNFVRTLATHIHQVLVHADPNLYSFDHILDDLCRHPELTILICEAFMEKFHPKRVQSGGFEEKKEEFKTLLEQLDTGHESNDYRRKMVLQQGMNFVEYTLKTNFFRKNKTAFAFRLDPQYLDHVPFDRLSFFPKLPYGIFFIKGMHFFAFHIRFKDLSRGGLRTVLPSKKERMLVERDRIFTECYNLAFTQDKKNKDIPEGGAKGVIFLKPDEHLSQEAQILAFEMRQAGLEENFIEEEIRKFLEDQKKEYLYQTQRSFIKNFLSLINCREDGELKEKDIIDYWKKPEYIYLGPDENMHNSMIEWIARESCKDDYRPGSAFISGKPSMGINHKEYGVTSLGVSVYVDETLRYFGIDPKNEPFTVKMTGGPDGDVAGNLIYNLYKEYPKTAKLVALTDVSGTIHDPKGLDLNVLVSLFKSSQSICNYPHEKLSIGGFLLDLTQKKELSQYVQQTLCWKNKDGKAVSSWLSGNEMNGLFRNNVHQTLADIFIPCGGRPRTLGDRNWADFLDPNGLPTSKAIVEGANLYLSNKARQKLEEKGVLIIKDSSANKGGVICSSFEILCGLTLKDEDFIRRKEQLVKEILERLAFCARQEGQLLLMMHQELKKSLSELSEELSLQINTFFDQLLSYLDPLTLEKDSALMRCFLSYCIPTLRRDYEADLIQFVPENHKKAVIAAHLAARLVYTKGLNWNPTLPDILPVLLEDAKLYTIYNQ